jgi:hypothetical protein
VEEVSLKDCFANCYCSSYVSCGIYFKAEIASVE